MRRRRFLALAGAAAAAPLATSAQQQGRVYRIGVLAFRGSTPAERTGPFAAFTEELGKAGFIEGKNLVIDRFGVADRADQFPELAAKLAATGADVLYSTGTEATQAATQATKTIPIAAIVDDMVGSGLVPSLAQPGGNLTGMSILATELDSKRQGLLFELLPQARRMMALVDPKVASARHFAHLREVGARREVDILICPVAGPAEAISAIETGRAAGAAAINVLASPLLYSARNVILEHSLDSRLPSIWQWPEAVSQGALIAYGPPFAEVYRQLARLVNKLLRGAQPAVIPIAQPTKFALAINLNGVSSAATGQAQSVPPSIAAAADVVNFTFASAGFTCRARSSPNPG
jgi:putative ABC transport system substrate-binding protein